MWSNAFCRTLELSLPDRTGAIHRVCGTRIRRIVAQPTGYWVLETPDGDVVSVRLIAGWLAVGGRLAGLAWRGEGRRRFACVLACRRPHGANWRRLLVRLRVPVAAGLS